LFFLCVGTIVNTLRIIVGSLIGWLFRGALSFS